MGERGEEGEIGERGEEGGVEGGRRGGRSTWDRKRMKERIGMEGIIGRLKVTEKR